MNGQNNQVAGRSGGAGDSSADHGADAGGGGAGAVVRASGVRAVALEDSSDPLLHLISRAASDPNVDVEKFERLMAMGERREQLAAVRAFNNALADAKGEIPSIAKNRVVDFTSQKGRTNYKHEDLAEICRTVDPILKRHGISYRWRSVQAGGKLSVTCIVSHRDGYSENTTLESAEDHSGNKNPTQAIGSAATYLQRYTLKLALGLAASNDDDSKRATADALISPEDAEILAILITETEADLKWILKHHKIESISDMSAADAAKAKAGLIARKRKMESPE